MKISVLGTGDVGQMIASRLVQLGHEVKMGSRAATNEKAMAWAKKAGTNASVGTFAESAKHGDVVFNCTLGSACLEALKLAGEANLGNKVLIDVSNPLDFSKGMPPSLFISNTDSMGETIQRAFPNVRVVKALNTMANPIMVNPRMLPDSHHTFLAGNDSGAKETVRGLLSQFGWKAEEIVDVGPISSSRGLEQWLPMWAQIFGATKNPIFNIKIVPAK